jgi:tRNA(fMet)-specific endonuclease VapC
MTFLLDTNTCSAYLKHRRGLAHRFLQHSGRLHVSSIVLGELFTWAYRRADPAPLLKNLDDDLLPQVRQLVFDDRCAREFGKVRARLLNAGHPIDALDLQIGVTALVHNLTLVTHNTRDYLHIPSLQLDDWLAP